MIRTEKHQKAPQPNFYLYDPRFIVNEWKAKPKLQPVGLQNLGNTCFMNAAIQCLTYTPALLNYLFASNHKRQCKIKGYCTLCELQKLVHEMDNKKGEGYISPTHIFNQLKVTCNMEPGEQQDSHEFLRFIVDHMANDALYGYRGYAGIERETTSIHQIFGGYLRSEVKCYTCKNRRFTYDLFMDISVDVKNMKTVIEALKRYVKPEVLSNANAYFCRKCETIRKAKKTMTIYRAPNVLTLHFKRFKYVQRPQRIQNRVDYGQTLNLREFMTHVSEDVDYSLFAVLLHHSQQANGGHYTCYVKNADETWFHVNDTSVVSIPASQVISDPDAYVLFYKRPRTVVPVLPDNLKMPPPPLYTKTESERHPSIDEELSSPVRPLISTFTKNPSAIPTPLPSHRPKISFAIRPQPVNKFHTLLPTTGEASPNTPSRNSDIDIMDNTSDDSQNDSIISSEQASIVSQAPPPKLSPLILKLKKPVSQEIKKTKIVDLDSSLNNILADSSIDDFTDVRHKLENITLNFDNPSSPIDYLHSPNNTTDPLIVGNPKGTTDDLWKSLLSTLSPISSQTRQSPTSEKLIALRKLAVEQSTEKEKKVEQKTEKPEKRSKSSHKSRHDKKKDINKEFKHHDNSNIKLTKPKDVEKLSKEKLIINRKHDDKKREKESAVQGNKQSKKKAEIKIVDKKDKTIDVVKQTIEPVRRLTEFNLAEQVAAPIVPLLRKKKKSSLPKPKIFNSKPSLPLPSSKPSSLSLPSDKPIKNINIRKNEDSNDSIKNSFNEKKNLPSGLSNNSELPIKRQKIDDILLNKMSRFVSEPNNLQKPDLLMTTSRDLKITESSKTANESMKTGYIRKNLEFVKQNKNDVGNFSKLTISDSNVESQTVTVRHSTPISSNNHIAEKTFISNKEIIDVSCNGTKSRYNLEISNKTIADNLNPDNNDKQTKTKFSIDKEKEKPYSVNKNILVNDIKDSNEITTPQSECNDNVIVSKEVVKSSNSCNSEKESDLDQSINIEPIKSIPHFEVEPLHSVESNNVPNKIQNNESFSSQPVKELDLVKTVDMEINKTVKSYNNKPNNDIDSNNVCIIQKIILPAQEIKPVEDILNRKVENKRYTVSSLESITPNSLHEKSNELRIDQDLHEKKSIESERFRPWEEQELADQESTYDKTLMDLESLNESVKNFPTKINRTKIMDDDAMSVVSESVDELRGFFKQPQRNRRSQPGLLIKRANGKCKQQQRLKLSARDRIRNALRSITKATKICLIPKKLDHTVSDPCVYLRKVTSKIQIEHLIIDPPCRNNDPPLPPQITEKFDPVKKWLTATPTPQTCYTPDSIFSGRLQDRSLSRISRGRELTASATSAFAAVIKPRLIPVSFDHEATPHLESFRKPVEICQMGQQTCLIKPTPTKLADKNINLNIVETECSNEISTNIHSEVSNKIPVIYESLKLDDEKDFDDTLMENIAHEKLIENIDNQCDIIPDSSKDDVIDVESNDTCIEKQSIAESNVNVIVESADSVEKVTHMEENSDVYDIKSVASNSSSTPGNEDDAESIKSFSNSENNSDCSVNNNNNCSATEPLVIESSNDIVSKISTIIIDDNTVEEPDVIILDDEPIDSVPIPKVAHVIDDCNKDTSVKLTKNIHPKKKKLLNSCNDVPELQPKTSFLPKNDMVIETLPLVTFKSVNNNSLDSNLNASCTEEAVTSVSNVTKNQLQHSQLKNNDLRLENDEAMVSSSTDNTEVNTTNVTTCTKKVVTFSTAVEDIPVTESNKPFSRPISRRGRPKSRLGLPIYEGEPPHYERRLAHELEELLKNIPNEVRMEKILTRSRVRNFSGKSPEKTKFLTEKHLNVSVTMSASDKIDLSLINHHVDDEDEPEMVKIEKDRRKIHIRKGSTKPNKNVESVNEIQNLKTPTRGRPRSRRPQAERENADYLKRQTPYPSWSNKTDINAFHKMVTRSKSRCAIASSPNVVIQTEKTVKTNIKRKSTVKHEKRGRPKKIKLSEKPPTLSPIITEKEFKNDKNSLPPNLRQLSPVGSKNILKEKSSQNYIVSQNSNGANTSSPSCLDGETGSVKIFSDFSEANTEERQSRKRQSDEMIKRSKLMKLSEPSTPPPIFNDDSDDEKTDSDVSRKKCWSVEKHSFVQNYVESVKNVFGRADESDGDEWKSNDNDSNGAFTDDDFSDELQNTERQESKNVPDVVQCVYESKVRQKYRNKPAFLPVIKCCSKNCYEFVKDCLQKDIFDLYYSKNFRDQSEQLLDYLSSNSNCQSARRKWFYNIPTDINPEQSVCRSFLLSMLQIPQKRLRTVIEKVRAKEAGRKDEVLLDDMRGKHVKRGVPPIVYETLQAFFRIRGVTNSTVQDKFGGIKECFEDFLHYYNGMHRSKPDIKFNTFCKRYKNYLPQTLNAGLKSDKRKG